MAGSYRVRVSAKGRDQGVAVEFADEIVDFYLVQIWPSTPHPDEIVRTTSENAAYWQRAVGARR